jgi:hypothetical protein
MLFSPYILKGLTFLDSQRRDGKKYCNVLIYYMYFMLKRINHAGILIVSDKGGKVIEKQCIVR